MNEEISQIKKSTTYLTEIETLAQDILTDKQTKLQLSNGRNKYREAYRALQQSVDKKTWMKLSSVYIELATEECKSIVKNELDKIALDIDNLHKTIKDNVSKLRDLEHQPGIEGFRLNSMTAAEAKAIHRGFGLT